MLNEVSAFFFFNLVSTRKPDKKNKSNKISEKIIMTILAISGLSSFLIKSIITTDKAVITINEREAFKVFLAITLLLPRLLSSA